MKKLVLVLITVFYVVFASNFSQAGVSDGGIVLFDGDYDDAIDVVKDALEDKNLHFVKMGLFMYTKIATNYESDLCEEDKYPFLPYAKHYIDVTQKYAGELTRIDGMDSINEPIYFSFSSVFAFDRIVYALVAMENGTWADSYDYLVDCSERIMRGEEGCDYSHFRAVHGDLNTFLAFLKDDLVKEGITYFDEYIEEKETLVKYVKDKLYSVPPPQNPALHNED